MKFIILAATVMSGWPLLASAQASPVAAFELATPQTVVHQGGQLVIELRIDSANQSINAADVRLQYNAAVLRVDHVSQGQSVFTLWPEPPRWDPRAGTISIIGGRPGGLYASHAAIASMTFTAVASGLAEVVIDPASSGLYANDGQGTHLNAVGTRLEIPVSSDASQAIDLHSPTQPDEQQWSTKHKVVVEWTPRSGTAYSYDLVTDPTVVLDEVPDQSSGSVTYESVIDGAFYFRIKAHAATGVWGPMTVRRVLIDSSPPEAFSIIHPDPQDVAGKDIISWTTTDAVSGIDHYLLDVGHRHLGQVTSPRHVESQWAGQLVVITAVDSAGNSRQAQWRAPGQPLNQTVMVASGVVLFTLAVVFISSSAWRKRRR